jgi:hypothetical protein
MNQAIICDTPDKILAFQLLSIRSALKLEILGMKHSRGSVAQHVRRMMSVRTRDKQKLLEIYESFLKAHGFLQS